MQKLLLSTQIRTPLGAFLLGGEILGGIGVVMPKRAMRVYGAYALMAVTQGAGEYRDANGVRETLAPGSVVTVFPELPHWYGTARRQTWSEIYLTFEGAQFDGWRTANLLDTRRPVAHPGTAWTEELRTFAGGLSMRPATVRAQWETFAAFGNLLPPCSPRTPRRNRRPLLPVGWRKRRHYFPPQPTKW